MADDEEEIEYLFCKVYTLEGIVGLQSVDYGIKMNLSTSKRKLENMNLSRKNLNYDIKIVSCLDIRVSIVD